MRMLDSKFAIDIFDGEAEVYKMSNMEVIPLDEPLFLFRCRDRLALKVLEFYRELCVKDGCNDYQLINLDKQITLWKQWQEQNEDKLKQPGITRGQ